MTIITEYDAENHTDEKWTEQYFIAMDGLPYKEYLWGYPPNLYTCWCKEKCGGGPVKWAKAQAKKAKGGKIIAYWYSIRPKYDDENEWHKTEAGAWCRNRGEQEFIQKIKKFLSSNAIEDHYVQFEWKYPEKNFYKREGMHCHMLLTGEKLALIKQHIIRQKDKMFKLDLKRQLVAITDPLIIKDKIEYMNGIIHNIKDENKIFEKEWDIISRKTTPSLEIELKTEKYKNLEKEMCDCDPVLSEYIVKRDTQNYELPEENLPWKLTVEF